MDKLLDYLGTELKRRIRPNKPLNKDIRESSSLYILKNKHKTKEILEGFCKRPLSWEMALSSQVCNDFNKLKNIEHNSKNFKTKSFKFDINYFMDFFFLFVAMFVAFYVHPYLTLDKTPTITLLFLVNYILFIIGVFYIVLYLSYIFENTIAIFKIKSFNKKHNCDLIADCQYFMDIFVIDDIKGFINTISYYISAVKEHLDYEKMQFKLREQRILFLPAFVQSKENSDRCALYIDNCFVFEFKKESLKDDAYMRRVMLDFDIYGSHFLRNCFFTDEFALTDDSKFPQKLDFTHTNYKDKPLRDYISAILGTHYYKGYVEFLGKESEKENPESLYCLIGTDQKDRYCKVFYMKDNSFLITLKTQDDNEKYTITLKEDSVLCDIPKQAIKKGRVNEIKR